MLRSSHLDMFAFRRGATNAHHPQELVDILRKEREKSKINIVASYHGEQELTESHNLTNNWQRIKKRQRNKIFRYIFIIQHS
jgi:hypothetical protein